MFKLKQRPYNLLLFTAVILFISGLMVDNFSVDIHLHDTYYIVPVKYFLWLPASLMMLLWLLYLLTKRFLYSSTLTWLHIILTVFFSVFILVVYYWSARSSDGILGVPAHYYNNGIVHPSQMFGNINNYIQFSFFILFFAQLVFIFHFIKGIYKRK